MIRRLCATVRELPYGRVGEQAHAHAVEQCELAAKAQKILDSFDPPKEPR